MKIRGFDYEEFKNVIRQLEIGKVKYYVFGGFAIDAINKEKNEHEDLDLIILNSDTIKLIEILKGLDYSMKKFGRILIFTRKYYQIGIMIMKEFKKYYRIRGNWHEDIISKDAFEKENYLTIRDIKFRTMPFEWFSLYSDIKHRVPEKADRHIRAVNKAKNLSKKIRILEGRMIKRLKSDPLYNKN